MAVYAAMGIQVVHKFIEERDADEKKIIKERMEK
jgi:hypothetical protein